MCLEWEPCHSQHALCCYLLPPSFCFSCEILIAATSSGLHLFTWATQILGFFLPSLWFMAGWVCPARHRKEPTAQSTGDLLARYFKGSIALCASEFQLGAPVLCVRCIMYYRQPSSRVNIRGLGSSGRCCPESAHPPRTKPREHNLMHWCCFEVFNC